MLNQQLQANKPKKPLPVLAFQLCVITNNLFGSDTQLYTISKMMMLLFFAVVALGILLRGGRFRLGKNVLLPIAFTAYSALSIVWSYSENTAYSQFITQVQLFLLLIFTYLVMIEGGTIKDYLDAVYVSGFGMIIFAMIKYGGLENYIAIMEEGERMGEEIANQNTYGMLFANASLCATYYMFTRKQKRHMLSILLFAFFALSSGSKKATVLIIVGVLGVSTVWFGIRKLHKTLFAGVLILAGAWFLLQLPIFEVVNERLDSFLSGELNMSDRNRMHMIQYGLELFKHRPVLGYGLDNFRVLYIERFQSHNNYVELLVSGGIVGLVLYYLMYLYPVCTFLFGKNRKLILQNQLYLMLLLWLAVDIVFGFGMVQFYGKNAWILLGVALAVADKSYTDVRVQPEKAEWRPSAPNRQNKIGGGQL